MTYKISGPLAPAFIVHFARQNVESSTELVQIWAQDDLLDVHHAQLKKLTDDYVSGIMGLVGAIQANRDRE